MPGTSASPEVVVHVVQNLAIGGLERVVLNLVRHAHRERYRPMIVCLGPGGPLADEARAAGIEVTVLNQRPGFRLATVLSLARRWRKHKVRVVHCHNAAPLVYGALAGRLAGAGVVYTAHGMKTSGARKPVRLDRLGLVDAFVTVSDDARRIALESAGADPARVRTIVNGVDTAAYRRATAGERARARQALGLRDDAFVFGIVARLASAKDHAILFRAVAKVTREEPRFHLVVVGDGELRDSLQGLIRELHLEEHILMAGSRSDVAQLMAAFDAFVLSSYTEGLAMTLLEAMAAELPIVATRVGGNAEVVVDGETGRIVPPRDADRLADALQWMATHPDAARAMGTRGRERAVARFSVEAMVTAYEAAYAEASR